MFLGEFKHALDEKGRVFIPARFRAGENQKFYVTRGLEKCLFVFPEEVWAEYEKKIKKMGLMNKDARAFNRFFFGGTAETMCDKQGRINLPSTLIEYSGLEKEVMIVGVSNRFEIWSVELWRQYEKEAGESYEEIAERLVERSEE